MTNLDSADMYLIPKIHPCLLLFALWCAFLSCDHKTEQSKSCSEYFPCEIEDGLSAELTTDSQNALTKYQKLIACGEWDSALKEMRELLENHTKLDDLEKNEITLLIGEILWKQGEDAKAEDLLNELLDSIRGNIGEGLKGKILYNLGEIYYIRHYVKRESVLELVKKYHYLSKTARMDIKDSIGLTHSFSRLGVIHQRERNTDSALYYFHKAIEISDKKEYEPGKARPYIHLGVEERAKNNVAGAYEFFWKGYGINKTFYNHEEIPFNIANIVRLESNESIIEKLGWSHMECALHIAEKIDFKLGIVNTLFNMGSIKESGNDSIEAKKYYSRALEISDSVGFRTYGDLLRRKLDIQ